MNDHPADAALAAYVLGHHDEIDRAAVERHLDGCDRCLDEVGREARLELLLAAAGREDAFVSVMAPRRGRRWPVVAAAAVAVAAAAAAVALWRSRSETDGAVSRVAAARQDGAPAGTPAADPRPEWARGLRSGKVRCVEADGGLMCAAASSARPVRDDAAVEAGDLAREALLEHALARGGRAITAQRAVFVTGKVAAAASRDRDRLASLRHQVVEQALLGRRDTWYWEEYNALDGVGTEFVVYVRFRASKREIDEFLDRFQGATVERAELIPALPNIHWVLDPGDSRPWFVLSPGRLVELGIGAGDVLLLDPRRNANHIRALVESDQLQVWRAGLERPVLPSQLR